MSVEKDEGGLWPGMVMHSNLLKKSESRKTIRNAIFLKKPIIIYNILVHK